MDSRRSISSLFDPSVARDVPVAIQDGKQVTFGDLERDVACLAGCLEDRGKGRWLLISEDAYAIAVGFLAALYARQTVVLPANLQLGYQSELADQIDGVLVHEHSVPSDTKALSILGRDRSEPEPCLAPFDPEDGEVILHTSGTTGRPVPVRKSLRCFEAELAALQNLFQSPLPYIVLATVPAHHIYGLLFRVLWPLVAGRPFVAELIRFPGELVKAMETAENSLLVSSPAFLSRALPVLDIEALKDRLCGVFSSGGPLPPDIAAAYNAKLTDPIVEVYGSTETGGIGYRSVRKASDPSPWTPLPGVTLSLEADDGRLSVSSPFLVKSRPFRTADTARLLPDGRFELLGRSDRIVKVEERRISLTEVEHKLISRSEVSAVRVVSLEGAKGRSVLGAVIVPSPEGWAALAKCGKRPLTDALRTALMPYFDLAAIPRKWRFVRRMPETIQGKTPMRQLEALFSPDHGGELHPIVLGREAGPSTLKLVLKLPQDLAYFDGHFDEHPVLPGVVQLDWAIDFAREEFPLDAKFQRIEALKFFRILSAGDEVTLDLRFERDKEKLHFRYQSADHEHSAGRIQFEATE